MMRMVALCETTRTSPDRCARRMRSTAGRARAATWNPLSPPGAAKMLGWLT